MARRPQTALPLEGQGITLDEPEEEKDASEEGKRSSANISAWWRCNSRWFATSS
jgi:hypothetical protein